MDYKKAYQELSQVVLESDNLGLMSKLKNINDQIVVEEEKPPKKEMTPSHARSVSSRS